MLLVAVLAIASAAAETLRVPSFLSDNMVLQRKEASLWGWAPANATVTVHVTSANPNGNRLLATATAAAAADGRWITTVRLDAQNRTQVTILATGAGSLVLHNVAWGDVFLCGGQSNSK